MTITYQGRTLSVADWARELGLSRTAMRRRLDTMPLEQALTMPYRDTRRTHVPAGPTRCKDADTGTLAGFMSRHGTDMGFVPGSEAEPTDARPGSREKVEVMRRRAEQGQPLWHPRDPVLRMPTDTQVAEVFRYDWTERNSGGVPV